MHGRRQARLPARVSSPNRMIRIAPPSQPLSPAEDYGLSVLVDLSRLVVLESPPGAEAAGPYQAAAARMPFGVPSCTMKISFQSPSE